MSSFGEVVPSFFWHRARIWQILVILLNLVIILLQNYCGIIRPVKVRFWFCCFIGFDGSAALFPSFVCIRCLFSLNCLWLLKNAVKITMCFWLSCLLPLSKSSSRAPDTPNWGLRDSEKQFIKHCAYRLSVCISTGTSWSSGDMFNGGHHSCSDWCGCERVRVW